MGFKGTSFIELTDVHTGEKQVYEDNNLVTMAVPKALGVHFGYVEKDLSAFSGVLADFLPVVPRAIGGILCFENPLVEDASVLYAEPSNKVVGCSSNDSHSTASAIRGSMNAAESGPLDDGTGYRFVFDFATSQGNGTISALALTSYKGGVSAFGDAVNPFSWNYYTGNTSSITMTSSNFKDYKRLVAVVSYMVSVRPEKGDAVALIPLDTGDIEIVSVAFPVEKVDLSGGYWKEPKSYRTLATITPSKAFFNGNDTGTQTSYFYGTFLDGGDGYWWGFSNSRSSSTTTNIYWLKINQETFAVEEGKWTLNNLSLDAYTSTAYSDTLNDKYWYGSDDSYILRKICHGVIGGGYLYLMRYNRTQVYKINLSQPTDITAIDISTVDDISRGYSSYPRQYLQYAHGRVYMPTGWIDSDNTFNEAKISWSDLGFMPAVYRTDQVYSVSFARSNGGSNQCYYNIRPHLITPYLATINNLDTPVTKTADKTMKITYILREE